MGKIILWMSVSIDGYFEGPNREIDWHRIDEEFHAYVNAELRGMGAFADGRVTYELMADYWPTADADPGAPPLIAEFAAIWRDIPKYVFSRTLDKADWNTTVLPEVDPDQIRAILAEVDGDVVIGGADLAETFFDLDLVDELRLYIHPVVLGEGRPLFPKSAVRRPQRLIETHTFGNGVVMLRYERV